jgi:hypothetical protein
MKLWFGVVLLAGGGMMIPAFGEPVINSISPQVRPAGAVFVNVTIAGTGLGPSPSFTFNPANSITVSGVAVNAAGTQITATFTPNSGIAGFIYVSVTVNNLTTNPPVIFSAGPLASANSTDCPMPGDPTKPQCRQLAWEVDGNASTSTGAQINAKTTPNVIFKLDYLWKTAKSSGVPVAGGAGVATPQGFTDHMVTHLEFRTGLTQASVADKLQPLATGVLGSSNRTPTPTTCPAGMTGASGASGASGAMGSCMGLTTRQAFVVGAGARVGWVLNRDGYGNFSEFGFVARGSFQALFTGDQVVTGSGISFADLGSLNTRDAVGLYEGVARFRIAQSHDNNSLRRDAGGTAGAFKKNVEDLLVIEAGYQNNSGLAHLMPNNTVNTRNRFVGRFYAYPEINKTTHTKVLFGVDYDGGINGGLRDIKIFYGFNLDPSKLITPEPKSP